MKSLFTVRMHVYISVLFALLASLLNRAHGTLCVGRKIGRLR